MFDVLSPSVRPPLAPLPPTGTGPTPVLFLLSRTLILTRTVRTPSSPASLPSSPHCSLWLQNHLWSLPDHRAAPKARLPSLPHDSILCGGQRRGCGAGGVAGLRLRLPQVRGPCRCFLSASLSSLSPPPCEDPLGSKEGSSSMQ